MEKFTSPAFIASAGGFLAVLLMLYTLTRKKNSKDDGDENYLDQVRYLVADGKYREAAEIQSKRGNKKEAYNLLERGKSYGEASLLAEELGLLDRAAFHAEKSADYLRAAHLFSKLGEHDRSSQLYVREGMFAEAAEALEQVPDADLQRLAQLWEQALLAFLNQHGSPQNMAYAQLQKVQHMAHQSARSYEKTGNLPRAAQMYEICNKQDKVQSLRVQIQANPLAATLMGQHSDPLAAFNSMAGSSMGMMENSSLTPLGSPQPTVLGNETLSAIGKIVNSAVQTAVQNTQSPAQLVVPTEKVDDFLNPEYLKDAGVNINIISVPDSSGSSTPIQRETDRYKIGDKLGEGGMAVVYKAQDRVLEREVALKFLPEGVTQLPISLKYFEREAKAAAGLNHPNIITIYDFGVLNDRPFICMELLHGASLEDLLKRTNGKGMPLLSIFEVAEGLLPALDFAHSHHFVHRDIKPANIMYTHQHVIKLMDFGIARQGDESQKTIVAGTPQYMAPEQMVGKGIDHRTDLYGVGATLYELVTGLPPFKGLSRKEQPPQPSHIRPIPATLDKLIMWCLHPQPSKRPPSAFHLLRALRSVRQDMEGDPRYAAEMNPELATTQPYSKEKDIMSMSDPKTQIQTQSGLPPISDAPIHSLQETQLAETEFTKPRPHQSLSNVDLPSAPTQIKETFTHSNDSLDQLLAVYLDN